MRLNHRRGVLTPDNRGSIWDFMTEMERAFDDTWTKELENSETRFNPPVELQETEDHFLLAIDLPGVPEKDIKVELHDGRLSVSGERRTEHKENSGQVRRFERSFGKFERAFQLPTQVQEDKIQARFENGVLEVMIPKAERSKSRTIQVEAGKGGLFSKLLGRTETKDAEKTDSH